MIEDILERAEEAGREYTKEEQDQILAILDDAEIDRDEKLDGYCWVIDKLKGEAETIKAEEQRLAARRRVRENRIAYMKEAMKEHLLRVGQKKVETAQHTISLQAAGGRQGLDYEVELLPEEFKQTVERIVVAEELLRTRLAAGEEVTGAFLKPRKTVLRIR